MSRYIEISTRDGDVAVNLDHAVEVVTRRSSALEAGQPVSLVKFRMVDGRTLSGRVDGDLDLDPPQFMPALPGWARIDLYVADDERRAVTIGRAVVGWRVNGANVTPLVMGEPSHSDEPALGETVTIDPSGRVMDSMGVVFDDWGAFVADQMLDGYSFEHRGCAPRPTSPATGAAAAAAKYRARPLTPPAARTPKPRPPAPTSGP